VPVTLAARAARTGHQTGADHDWVAATYVPVEDEDDPARIARDAAMVLPINTKVIVLEVFCNSCRRPFDDVRDEPCVANDPNNNTHLRGGPIGVRRKRKCPIHNDLYTKCEHLHEEPHNYQRPPMPPLEVIAGWRAVA